MVNTAISVVLGVGLRDTLSGRVRKFLALPRYLRRRLCLVATYDRNSYILQEFYEAWRSFPRLQLTCVDAKDQRYILEAYEYLFIAFHYLQDKIDNSRDFLSVWIGRRRFSSVGDSTLLIALRLTLTPFSFKESFEWDSREARKRQIVIPLLKKSPSDSRETDGKDPALNANKLWLHRSTISDKEMRSYNSLDYQGIRLVNLEYIQNVVDLNLQLKKLCKLKLRLANMKIAKRCSRLVRKMIFH
ncbi:hypothetical protein HAX54_001021, partial [Datura stramonium]|nr:hypothetical protein [Datura stramonium]